MRALRPTLPRGPETRELRGMPKASSEADEMRTFASVIDVAAALIIADRCPVHRPHPLSTGVKAGRIIADVGKGVDGSPRGNALRGRGAPIRGRLAATGSGTLRPRPCRRPGASERYMPPSLPRDLLSRPASGPSDYYRKP